MGWGQQPWNTELERVRGPGLWEWPWSLSHPGSTWQASSLHMTKTALLAALAIYWKRVILSYFVTPERGESTYIYRHAGLQGLGMRNCASSSGTQGFTLALLSWRVKNANLILDSVGYKKRREYDGRRRTCWGTPGGAGGGFDQDTLYVCVKLSKNK